MTLGPTPVLGRLFLIGAALCAGVAQVATFVQSGGILDWYAWTIYVTGGLGVALVLALILTATVAFWRPVSFDPFVLLLSGWCVAVASLPYGWTIGYLEMVPTIAGLISVGLGVIGFVLVGRSLVIRCRAEPRPVASYRYIAALAIPGVMLMVIGAVTLLAASITRIAAIPEPDSLMNYIYLAATVTGGLGVPVILVFLIRAVLRRDATLLIVTAASLGWVVVLVGTNHGELSWLYDLVSDPYWNSATSPIILGAGASAIAAVATAIVGLSVVGNHSASPDGVGWHPDPFDVAEWRWWDGTAWTNYILSPGMQSPAPPTPIRGPRY